MIYSKTSEYAIRILVFMARQLEGKPVTIKEVSAGTAIPQAYTAKVLQFLAREKFLKSAPGPSGGFLLRRDPEKLSLYEVLATVDNFPKCYFADCVMGLEECDDKNPCVLHDVWMETKNRIMKILSKTTIQGLVLHRSSFRMGSRSKRVLSQSMRNIFRHGVGKK